MPFITPPTISREVPVRAASHGPPAGVTGDSLLFSGGSSQSHLFSSVPAAAKGPDVLHWGQLEHFGTLPGFTVTAQGT